MRIGVDVGGSKIEAAAIADTGEIVLRRRVATPEHDYAAAVEAVAALIFGVEADLGRRCPIGCGIPGAISPATGLVKNAPNAPIQGRPFDRDLAERLDRPVRMMNDANCFALSEARDGSGAGAAVVFGVILGTGCGGGVVIGGDVLTGTNAVAGEWGHNPLPWPHDDERPGLRCGCGKYGCIESFLSGTSLSRHHTHDTGERLDAATVVARADAGDASAEESMRRYENRLARALASVINLIDPDVIVLGGGMSKTERLYHSVPAQWHEWVFSDRIDTRLVPPRYGDSSGVRGAAWLWPAGTTV